ncbi:unnamed protein product [Sphagnum balticum]
MCLAQFCGVVSWSRFARISLISVADSEGSGRRSSVCCTRKVPSVRQQISTKRASNNGDAANTTCVRTSSRTSGTIAEYQRWWCLKTSYLGKSCLAMDSTLSHHPLRWFNHK